MAIQQTKPAIVVYNRMLFMYLVIVNDRQIHQKEREKMMLCSHKYLKVSKRNSGAGEGRG